MSAQQSVFLTVEELAERLKIPVSTIYRHRMEGKAPPAMRVGRHLRFRLDDVEQWERERTTTGSRR